MTTIKTSNKNTQTRYLSLDFLKGLSILLVVFFHNVKLNPLSFADNLWMLACCAAVPCFFLVSGAVFLSRPLSMEKHIRRIIRFYLTVTIWRFIYLIFYHACGAPLNGSLRTLGSYLFFFQTLEGVETSHFWFMDAYLTVLLFAPLLHILMREHRKLALYTAALLFLFNQLITDGNLLFALIGEALGKPAWDISSFAEINPYSFRYSNYMLYYLLGGLLMENRHRFSKKTCGLAAAGGLLGLLLIKYIQSGTFLWQGLPITSAYYWISTMALACGIFLLITKLESTLFSSSEKNPVSGFLIWFAKTIGSSSLGIFYLHIPLIFLLTPLIFEKLAPWNGWILNMLESLLIAGIAYAITSICRHLPLIRHLF